MKTALTTLFLLVISAFAFSQDNDSGLEKTVSGPSFSTSRKSNFSGFIGQNENTIFAIDYLSINRKKQELQLRRFHATDLQLVDSKELFTVINENFYNEPNEIFFQNNTIYLFSTLSGLKDKYNMIYLEIFNEYGEKTQEGIIDTIQIDEKYYLAESIEKDGFLIATHNKYENIFDQTIGLRALDQGGNTLWEKSVKSPVAIQNMTIEQVHYSTEAPLYILCNYGFDRGGSVRENNTDLLNNKYALWAYDPEKEFLKEFDLRIKNRWMNGVALAYNSDKDLIVTGFMNETRNQTINGVFSLKIGIDLNVINSSYYKYKRPFYEKFVDAKRIDKTKELEDIDLKHCIVLEDDSYFVLGEHFYQYTERNYDPRTNITTTTENYNYNSIVVAYFDASGNHLWSDRVPKFQHTINDYGYYSSFSAMYNGTNLYLFFNDSDKNNELTPNDYFNYKGLSNNRRFQISYVSADQSGIKARGALVAPSNNFMLRARQSYQIKDDTFYLYGEVGKSRRLFSVKPN